MEARPAVANDAGEIVRLARLMFESMGIDLSDATWEEEGRRQVRERIGGDVAVFVVDDPIRPGRLVASAAGVITRRLPTPSNEHGLVGYRPVGLHGPRSSSPRACSPGHVRPV